MSIFNKFTNYPKYSDESKYFYPIRLTIKLFSEVRITKESAFEILIMNSVYLLFKIKMIGSRKYSLIEQALSNDLIKYAQINNIERLLPLDLISFINNRYQFYAKQFHLILNPEEGPNYNAGYISYFLNVKPLSINSGHDFNFLNVFNTYNSILYSMKYLNDCIDRDSNGMWA